jgi:hypothetical protein
MLHQIIYASHSLVPMNSKQLVDLLEKSRRNNSELGVTGLLLHADGSFMQTIEGERDTVHPLLAKIERDPRHTGILLIGDEPVAKRSYGDWSMAFREIRREDAARLPGFQRKPGIISAHDRDVARNLMRSFFENADLGRIG